MPVLDRLSRFFRGTPDEPTPPAPGGGGLALVLTGGGARAAYQAGVIRGVAKRFPAFRPQILTGVSAGALNASFLAATAHEPFVDAAAQLVEIWRGLEADDVFRVDRPGVMGTVAKFVRPPQDVDPPAEGGFLDTSPLQAFVERLLGSVGHPIAAIDRA
ncbi:MAG: patatin-like phospholipase family protein, partial [Bacteroidota bacterium]